MQTRRHYLKKTCSSLPFFLPFLFLEYYTKCKSSEATSHISVLLIQRQNHQSLENFLYPFFLLYLPPEYHSICKLFESMSHTSVLLSHADMQVLLEEHFLQQTFLPSYRIIPYSTILSRLQALQIEPDVKKVLLASKWSYSGGASYAIYSAVSVECVLIYIQVLLDLCNRCVLEGST